MSVRSASSDNFSPHLILGTFLRNRGGGGSGMGRSAFESAHPPGVRRWVPTGAMPTCFDTLGGRWLRRSSLLQNLRARRCNRNRKLMRTIRWASRLVMGAIVRITLLRSILDVLLGRVIIMAVTRIMNLSICGGRCIGLNIDKSWVQQRAMMILMVMMRVAHAACSILHW